MNDSGLFVRLRNFQRTSLIVSSLLICLMMVALVVGVVQFGNRMAPDWRGGYLPWMAAFLSLEAFYTRRTTRDLDFNERVIFHISEWIAFAVVMKLLIYAYNGFDTFLPDLRRWQESFTDFFTLEYLIAMLIAGVVWYSSRSYSSELDDLFDREHDASWDDLGKLQNALNDIRARMMSRVFFQGTVLVVFAILTRITDTELLRTFGIHTPGYRAPVANVLIYFMLALVLLSQTQFALLRTRWTWLRLNISPSISGNWVKYSLLFFALLSIIVFFLPTEYTLGFFATMQGAAAVLTQLIGYLILLLSLPFTLCFSLFKSANEQAETANPPRFAPPPLPPGDPSDPSIAWLGFIRSLFFWIIFLGVIGFAVMYYARQNTALWNSIRGFPLAKWLRRAWLAFRTWSRGVNRQVSQMVQQAARRIRRPTIATPSLRQLFDIRRMSPREKVIFFFVNLTQLGGERGIGRKPYQTPYQYEGQLSHAVPDVEPDLHSLTEAFYEARYSRHPFEEPQAEQANSLWDRIKEILRRWNEKP